MRQALLVIGCHRSGTSALTRALSLVGWQLPLNLMPGNKANAPGFWEPLDIVRFNESLLERQGRSWVDPKPMPPEGGFDPQDRQKAGMLLRTEYPGPAPLVLKDPRISRLLPFWREAIARSGMTPAIIIACRNPAEVCRSLEARDRLSRRHAEEIWLAHNLEAEHHSRGLPRAIVHYEDLVVDPRGTLQRALAGIGADASGITEAAWRQAEESLGPVAPPQPAAGSEAGGLVAETYARLRKASGLQEAAAFDALRETWQMAWRDGDPGDGPSRLAFERPETHLAISRRLLAEGKTADALRAAEQAAALASRNGSATVPLLAALSQVLMELGGLDSALAQARLALSLDNGNPALHLRVAQILNRTGQTAEAEAAYRAVLDLDPGHGPANRQLGLLLFQLGQAEESLAFIAKAIAAQAGDHGLLHLQALALAKAGHVEDALRAIRRAIALDTGNAGYQSALQRLLKLQSRK